MSGLELLEPFTRRWMELRLATGGPSLTELTIAEARELSLRNQGVAESASIPRDENVEHERRQACGCTVHILRPKAALSPLPALLYLHGGGWALGDFSTHARFLFDLISLTDVAIVFPEYDRAPEMTFPKAVEQCFQIAGWMVQDAAFLGLDPSRMAVGGDSSGGNLAAVVAMLAAQRGGPELRLQALVYPVADYDPRTESYREFGSGFRLDASVMEWFWDRYVPDFGKRSDPLASPLRAGLEELRGAAPALIFTAECDILRDGAEAFARKLAEAGVPTAAYRCMGTVHGFLVDNGLADSPPARSAMRTLAAHLRWALR